MPFIGGILRKRMRIKNVPERLKMMLKITTNTRTKTNPKSVLEKGGKKIYLKILLLYRHKGSS